MRRGALVATALALLVTPAFAADPANTARVRDWRPMSMAIQGNALTYAISTTNPMRGGYTFHQTDSFRIPLRGTRLAPIGRRVQGALMRTSAGAGTAGPLSADVAGRHLLVATGRNHSPQVIACCTDEGLPTAVEVSGAPDAPIAVAGVLEWPAAHLLAVSGGRLELVSYGLQMASPYPTTPRISRSLADAPPRRMAAIAPGALAWLDAASGGIRVMATPSSVDGPPQDVTTIPPPGDVRRLLVAAGTVAVLRGSTATGYELVRFDAPGWTATSVWRGATPPEAVALDGVTLVAAVGRRVFAHTPGGGRVTVVRVARTAAAVATDGSRVAVLERGWLRGRKSTTMRVWSLPGATTSRRSLP